MKRCFKLILLVFMLMACKEAKNENSGSAGAEVTSTEQLQSDQGTTYLKGIDIYDANPEVDWNTVKQSDIAYVFIKATEGKTYLDTVFNRHWPEAKAAGIIRGPFHYYVYDDDPVVQADFFIQTVTAAGYDNDLPPVLDLEDYKESGKVSIEAYQNNVKQWLKKVEEAFNKKPIIYVSVSYANTYLNDSAFGDYPLWIADWDAAKPGIPAPWKDKGWLFWQYEANKNIDGVSGTADRDYFVGSMAALKQLQ